jgi:hypothetical protein
MGESRKRHKKWGRHMFGGDGVMHGGEKGTENVQKEEKNKNSPNLVTIKTK